MGGARLEGKHEPKQADVSWRFIHNHVCDYDDSSQSKALASFRSSVSKPSVNHP
jgi:hypothetical protein